MQICPVKCHASQIWKHVWPVFSLFRWRGWPSLCPIERLALPTYGMRFILIKAYNLYFLNINIFTQRQNREQKH